MAPPALTEVGGNFVRITFADTEEIALRRGLPHRPAGRFNRPGQDALYLSPDALSASVALGGYAKPYDPPRVLVRYTVECCVLLDLRDPRSAALHERARQPWRSALDHGEEPASWAAADVVRASGAAGLIDPSRRRPGLWHVTLFRWNEPGAPNVRRFGAPEPIVVEPDFR